MRASNPPPAFSNWYKTMKLNIELDKNFPAGDRAQANFEIAAFNMLSEANMGLFKQAWTGWPKDETRPNPNRSESATQNVFEQLAKAAFKDIYK